MTWPLHRSSADRGFQRVLLQRSRHVDPHIRTQRGPCSGHYQPRLIPTAIHPGNLRRDGQRLGHRRVANIFPVRHLNEAMVEVFNPFTDGDGIKLGV